MKISFLCRSLGLLLVGIALLTAKAGAVDKTVDLGAGKVVVYNLPATWEIAPMDLPQDKLPEGIKTLKLSPKSGANAVCTLSLLTPPDNRLADHEALKALVMASGESFAADTIEGKVEPKEFKTPHGFGYSATFTDKTLVGKPSEPGNYKNATVVVLYLPEQIVATAMILCDDPAGPDYAALLTMLRSIGARSASNTI